MAKMGNISKSFKIRTKIILLYISVLILSIIFTVVSFSVINEKKIEQESSNSGMQTVTALKGNLSFIFENVTQFSNLIYFDDNVQDALSRIKFSSIDYAIQNPIQKSMSNMLLSGDYISSVVIIDNYSNYYSVYKSGSVEVNDKRFFKAKWYIDVKNARGNILFKHRSDNVLSFSNNPDKNYISLIRIIANVNNYDPLAILIITVDEETFQKYFDEVGKEYNSQFCIVDSRGNYVIKPSGYSTEMDNYIEPKGDGEQYQVVKDDGEKKIIVRQELGIEDWSLIGVFPVDTSSHNVDKFYMTWIVIIIFLNLFFVFTCSLVLTKLIFGPLNKIQKHMKLVEDGQLIEMAVDKKHTNEINDVKKVFNQMINSIQHLISKVKNEEKIIAKNELDIIQAQINPHFLYNTLDAVSALALIKDTDSCFNMTQALGNFYRNSLNSGLDLIIVNDEIECIKSYVTILNIRYDNKIILKTDIEENIRDCKILKLILQPIIENAVHHGIRNKKGAGTIMIKGYKDEEEIIFCVADDGTGMTEEQIQKILNGETQNGKSGFGLFSSIQRISLYYDIENPVTITSEIGNGTEVTIRVKALRTDMLGKSVLQAGALYFSE